MAGLLEAVLTMCVCKVGFSILCLPMVRGPLSSVGLCCGCLLLFTDLAITVFLAFLWLSGSWLVPFTVSTDSIAHRFLLFLTHTYGGVMLLIIPLVAVEMAFHLHWPQLRGMEGECGGKGFQTKGEEGSARAEPKRAERQNRTASSAGALAHVACVLSCLLAWCISGLRAERHWDLGVELCLEGDTGGSGGSLWRCLPSLLSAAWPDFSEPYWGLPAAAVLLGLCGSLRLISLRPTGDHVCPEKAERSSEGKERKRSSTELGRVQTRATDVRPESAKLSSEKEREREHSSDVDNRGKMQTRPVLCALANPTGGVSTQTLTVDTGTTSGRCCVLSTVAPQGSEQPRPPPPHGKNCPSSQRFALPGRCGPPTETETVARQIQNKQSLVLAQPLRQNMPEMCFACTTTQSESSGSQTDPQQLCYQPCRQSWDFPGGSPSPRGLLIVGLVWGVFICLFPVPLGFSVLLIRHTETLVLFGLKVLTQSPSHNKHTEST
ncbi:uncharacterized protein LOC116220508 isoform X2 [Clupea harengus]|nr:uncharacterized protein LOC116220508 isoform X2 [Clupea harengus]XP_031423521.1 uncharacterized protein LOC116220508 isoform X2 [Clupea harengus]